MADFSDIIKQFKRMCWYYSRNKIQKSCPMCTSYPNCNIGQCRKIAFEEPEHFAATVMRWAAEHPKPKYPTWWKYMCMIGVIPEELGDKTLGEMTIYSLMNTHIQSDIAQKLGIEPEEGA